MQVSLYGLFLPHRQSNIKEVVIHRGTKGFGFAMRGVKGKQSSDQVQSVDRRGNTKCTLAICVHRITVANEQYMEGTCGCE